jgi:translation initiation factor 2 beta subunit (eIF-2beta)/eIF-5
MKCNNCKSVNTQLVEDGGFVSFFKCNDCGEIFVYNPFVNGIEKEV